MGVQHASATVKRSTLLRAHFRDSGKKVHEFWTHKKSKNIKEKKRKKLQMALQMALRQWRVILWSALLGRVFGHHKKKTERKRRE